MTDLEILENIVLDYQEGINFLHEAVISNYRELSDIRNKKFQIEKLIKSMQKKQ
jgi:hypothetical protein